MRSARNGQQPSPLTEIHHGRLTTHVLDTANVAPAGRVRITLYRNAGERYMLIGDAVTNQDGRCDGPLLEGDTFTRGRYRLVFAAGEYFARAGVALPDPPFVDEVVLDFGVADAALHYHVPLLVSRGVFRHIAAVSEMGSLRRRVAAAPDPLGPSHHRHRLDRRVVLFRLPRQQPAAAQAQRRCRRRHRR